MKFTITFKDPDGYSDAVKQIVQQEIEKLNLPEDEAEELVEIKTEKLNDFLSTWISYSEYISIEFDTEAGTATVKKES